MADSVRTLKTHRNFYSANGFYFNPAKRKWAKINKEETVIKAFVENKRTGQWEPKFYRYEHDKEAGIVMSLKKEDWERKKLNEVPNAVYIEFNF
jgi:hypothetical protein